jgi:hypothetical protein
LAEKIRTYRQLEDENIAGGLVDFSSLEDLDEKTLEKLVVRSKTDVRADRIGAEVQSAVGRLSDDEREFLARFYNMGETYQQIADKSGRRIHSLEALHRRALKKLRKILAPLVVREYGVKTKTFDACPLCCSPFRAEIDALIAARPPEKTWRQVIRILKEKYRITIITPQTIIGHQKYH